MNIELNESRYLGSLCRQNHDYQATGKSIRRRASGKCVLCAQIAAQKHQQKHGQRRNKENHERRRKRKAGDFICRALENKHGSCRKNNIPFNLTHAYLKQLWETQRGLCYWLQRSMYAVQSGIHQHPMKPTLDRLYPERGYVIGNVVWASQLANLGRGNLPPDEFRQFLETEDGLIKR